MDITWYGLSCFRITERGYTTIVTDPFKKSIGLPEPKLKAEVVTVSHDSAGHNNIAAVTGTQHELTRPGEYEIGGVFITAIATHSKGTRNLHCLFNYDSLKVAHLGDLTKIPTQTQVEALGTVSVLLLPVGGGSSLNAGQAAEVVSLIEPSIIIPMHYATPGLKLELDPVDRFMKELGLTDIEEQDVLKVSASSLPEEPQVVLLKPKT